MDCSNQLENMMINMIIKIVIFDIFTQVQGQATSLAGFASFFHADWCRRYVKSSKKARFVTGFVFHSNKNLSLSIRMFFVVSFNVRGSLYNMRGPARAGLGYNMVGPVPLKYENRPKINRKQASRTPPEPYIF